MTKGLGFVQLMHKENKIPLKYSNPNEIYSL